MIAAGTLGSHRLFRPEQIVQARVIVTIPAHDEEDEIAGVLAALAEQRSAVPVCISLCVNNTTDSTAECAEAALMRHGLAAILTEASYPCGGVGRARAIGHAVAIAQCPQASWLLSTDADCRPAPSWIAGMVTALHEAPLALGKIVGSGETPLHRSARYQSISQLEAAYIEQATAFERLLCREGEPGIGLNTAGGANLGLRRECYLALGGFRALVTGEDRDIVDRAIEAGYRPTTVPDAVVRASMRSRGRAPGGMAEMIAARLSEENPRLDSALAPFATMLARRLEPTHSSPVPVLRMLQAHRDLPDLAACVTALAALPDPEQRLRFLAQSFGPDVILQKDIPVRRGRTALVDGP